MRVVAALLLVVIASGLAFVQAVSDIALRSSAQPGSWVRVVPERVARRVERIDPAFPLPPALRGVLVSRLIDERDLGAAALQFAHMPPSVDRLALDGRMREARGDAAGAAAAYLAAGDLEDLQRRVSELRVNWQTPEAVALERAIVTRLRTDPTQRDTLAQAYYDLGGLEETQAYRFALGDPKRALHERYASVAYAQAVALAPLEERYLVAYANQLLNIRRYDDARAAFERARVLDSRSAAPLAGLADLALRRGDRAEARTQFERAQRLDPADPEVQRLAHSLGG